MPQTRAVATKATKLSLGDEIVHLRDLDLQGLRARWKSMFRQQPPPHLPRHLLFAVLAYRLQADELGNLDPATARLLRQIAAAGGGTLEASQLTEEFARKGIKLRSGTILMREWKAQAYRVMVVDEGFDLNGKTYDSLSKVAFATPAPIGTVRASLVCGTRSRLRPGHEDGAVRRSIRCAIYTRVEVT